MRTWFCRAVESSHCKDPAPTVGRWRGILPLATIHAHGEPIARIANHPFVPLGRKAIINGNGVEVDNDAARRVATSSEKRENRFKPPYSKRETAAKGRPPPGIHPSHSTSVIKTWFSMGGMARAWRRQWQHRDRNATHNGIPANADCRGGVFATRRFPRPLSPCSATVFVATWRAASRLYNTASRLLQCRVAILSVPRRLHGFCRGCVIYLPVCRR